MCAQTRARPRKSSSTLRTVDHVDHRTEAQQDKDSERLTLFQLTFAPDPNYPITQSIGAMQGMERWGEPWLSLPLRHAHHAVSDDRTQSKGKLRKT